MARKGKKRRKSRKHSHEEAPKRKRRRRGKKRRGGGRRKGSSRRRRSGGRRRRGGGRRRGRGRRKGYRFTKRRRAALRKAQRSRRRRLRRGGGRKHHVRGHYNRRRKSRWRTRGHMSRERRGALQNPLSGGELIAGAVAGVIGYALSDIADRFIATRKDALVGSPTAPIYKDWMRLAAGVAFTAVPLIGAHYIKRPKTRAAAQFFGLAAGFRLAGKLVDDVSANLLSNNDYGKRLFAGEMYAQDAQKTAEAQATGTAGLPTGAGAPPPLPPAPNTDIVSVVKQHAPALRALGALASAFEAVGLGKATPEQKRQVEEAQRMHASSIKVLSAYKPEEVQKAMGLAGLTANAGGLAAPPSRAPAPLPAAPAAKPQPRAQANRFAWAKD